MQTVPLQAIANQTLQIQLNGQNCTISVQQTAYCMFLTLAVGTQAIVNSEICENLTRIVRYGYLGFIGDLVFQDTQGTSDPVYTGLGGQSARFQLLYLAPSDLAALGFSS
jgi:hypothetical protein